MRMLERATPRVKVFSIGTTEEGREMIAVAIASEKLIADLDQNRSRLARLADPRLIGMDDAEAERLVAGSVPVYYITGSIHAPETGAPTALMELAYRLAVDESPRVQAIRDRLIALITPVVEVDGRDRQVDIYNWHLAHPGQNWPNLIYWGKYVAHDNNRDAMGLTLKLTQNVLKTFVDWKAQVLHDLHESVPYLYLILREHVIDRLYDQNIGYWQPDLQGLEHLNRAALTGRTSQICHGSCRVVYRYLSTKY
jgi:hypothetical protein